MEGDGPFQTGNHFRVAIKIIAKHVTDWTMNMIIDRVGLPIFQRGLLKCQNY